MYLNFFLLNFFFFLQKPLLSPFSLKKPFSLLQDPSSLRSSSVLGSARKPEQPPPTNFDVIPEAQRTLDKFAKQEKKKITQVKQALREEKSTQFRAFSQQLNEKIPSASDKASASSPEKIPLPPPEKTSSRSPQTEFKLNPAAKEFKFNPKASTFSPTSTPSSVASTKPQKGLFSLLPIFFSSLSSTHRYSRVHFFQPKEG